MNVPYSYVKRFTAGAVFGMYMAYLLYFLNPQLDTDVPRVLLATVTYAIIAGLTFGTLLWLLRWLRVATFGRRTEGIRQYGFGSVATAAALSAAVYWAHLILFRIFLPRGAVRVLSKATILIAATTFVLFVLWFFERTASRRTSRLIFAAGVIAVGASAVLLYQRREGYRDTSREIVLAEAPRVASDQRIIFITLRSLPYDWVLTAIGEGLTPHLAAMHDKGFATRIEPFRTGSPKAIWASLATGQLPNRHGVTGRYSYRTALNRPGERFSLLPSGVGFRAWGLIPPVQRVAPQLPAGDSLPFWTCFGKMGIDSDVVNWPGTFPLRPHRGHLISDRAIRFGDVAAVTPHSDATIVSANLRTPLTAPVLARLERLREAQRRRVITAFASDARAAAVTSQLLRSSGTTLTVLALNSLDDALDAVGVNRNEMPPKGSASGDAVRAALVFFDTVIGALQHDNPGALFFVVSPSAPDPPPVPVSFVSIAQTIEDLNDPGENNGFIIAAGPGFTHRDNPDAVEVVDVVPTLFFTASLPIARDLDGAVIDAAFDDAVIRSRTVTYIASYRPEHFQLRR